MINVVPKMDNFVNFDFSCLCRVCLIKTSDMISLKCSFTKVLNNTETRLVIADVLANVLNFKVNLSENYPQFICSMCLDVLKTAYNFKILFEESHHFLQQCLGEIEEKQDEEKISDDSNKSKASVELIAGSNKYDIKDLVIVEDGNRSSDEVSFEGFLKNLGKSITATFVYNHNNNDKKNKNSTPDIEIQFKKIATSESDDSCNLKDKNRSNSLDEYILKEGKKLKKTIEPEIVTFSENDIKSLDIMDRDLLQSALNIKYECSSCQKVFVTEFRYKKHVATCSKEYEVNERQKILSKLKCQYCDKIFKERKYLNFHMKMHLNPHSFRCDICKINLKTNRALGYHKRTKHSESKYICQYCGKCFAMSGSLKLHLEIHTHRDTPQCICPVCGKTFHYKGGLFYHMKQHTNERKYQCEHCDRSFYTLFAKQRHVRTHTRIRPYACRYCDKMFFSLGERKKHEHIHTGTLPYHCQYCNKGFRSQYNLKVHWLNHSGDYECGICNRKFIEDGVLQFHCKLKHKDAIADAERSN